MPIAHSLDITRDATIPTWFHVGGRAARFHAPASIDDLARCLELDPNLRVLGDGANLLVDDDGVDELVVSLKSPRFQRVEIDERSGRVVAGAGADFPKLIHETVRRGLAGLEGLIGIPATLGGAAIMNAGGAFGELAAAIARVHALDRAGRAVALDRRDIPFTYRHSGLGERIITGVELALAPADHAALRDRLKECMAYKAKSQPMADRSAGCAFKNPTLERDLPDIGEPGQRVSAGMLIDRAGCKGLAIGSAAVSHRHANFLTVSPGGKARDVLRLMVEVRRRVWEAFGVALAPEVVIWSRSDDAARLAQPMIP